MNAQNIDNKPKVRKNTKNKIKVDFDRTPLAQRLKAKFLSGFFLKKIVWAIVRYVLLIGVAYIVLFPFFSKISSSVMAAEDFTDATVRLIPKNFTLDMYKEIWVEQEYLRAFGSTFMLSLSTALIQTFICCLIAYGLAKFKFKGNKIVFGLVLFTLIIPHQTIQSTMKNSFYQFDILGIFKFLNGGGITIFGKNINNAFFQSIDIFPDSWERMPDGALGINLWDSFWPLIILSVVGLAFKNGLYIFLLRQFFMGVPDELEESAYIDGSGVFHTFFTIILPISVPMMITVFLFAFSWCWTDDFYTNLFFSDKEKILLLPQIVGVPVTLKSTDEAYNAAVRNTCGLMIIAPLVVMYLFCQKYLVQGIERSGLTAD